MSSYRSYLYALDVVVIVGGKLNNVSDVVCYTQIWLFYFPHKTAQLSFYVQMLLVLLLLTFVIIIIIIIIIIDILVPANDKRRIR